MLTTLHMYKRKEYHDRGTQAHTDKLIHVGLGNIQFLQVNIVFISCFFVFFHLLPQLGTIHTQHISHTFLSEELLRILAAAALAAVTLVAAAGSSRLVAYQRQRPLAVAVAAGVLAAAALAAAAAVVTDGSTAAVAAVAAAAAAATVAAAAATVLFVATGSSRSAAAGLCPRGLSFALAGWAAVAAALVAVADQQNIGGASRDGGWSGQAECSCSCPCAACLQLWLKQQGLQREGAAVGISRSLVAVAAEDGKGRKGAWALPL